MNAAPKPLHQLASDRLCHLLNDRLDAGLLAITGIAIALNAAALIPT